MDLIERENHIALFDTYKELLTEKQQEYFVLYYYEDLSLKEIAEFKNVSRNAVFDQIKKVINILEEYEDKLKILAKSIKIEGFALKLQDDLKEELLSIIKE